MNFRMQQQQIKQQQQQQRRQQQQVQHSSHGLPWYLFYLQLLLLVISSEHVMVAAATDAVVVDPPIITKSTATTTTTTTSTTTTTQQQKQQQQQRVVLVTGGAGFIGSHVADALLLQDNTVVIILDEINDYYSVDIKYANLQYLRQRQQERQQERQQQQEQQEQYPGSNTANTTTLFIYKGDVADVNVTERIFTLHPNINIICHLAARAGVRPSISNPHLYFHSNVMGTVNLLQSASKKRRPNKDQIQNFVMASSSSVYGDGNNRRGGGGGGNTSTTTTTTENLVFSESDLVDQPISPYAASKKASELAAYTYHHLYNIPITALRFFTVYGPRGLRPDMAPYQFISKIASGQTIQQFGNGNTSRDYTYIDDIVQGILQSIEHPYPYQIINLGKGSCGTTLKQFIQLVESNLNQTAKLEILPEQPGDVPYTCANITKAKTLLGYNPQTSFPQGIQQTVQWYLEQQQQQQDTTITKYDPKSLLDDLGLEDEDAIINEENTRQEQQNAKKSFLKIGIKDPVYFDLLEKNEGGSNNHDCSSYYNDRLHHHQQQNNQTTTTPLLLHWIIFIQWILIILAVTSRCCCSSSISSSGISSWNMLVQHPNHHHYHNTTTTTTTNHHHVDSSSLKKEPYPPEWNPYHHRSLVPTRTIQSGDGMVQIRKYCQQQKERRLQQQQQQQQEQAPNDYDAADGMRITPRRAKSNDL